MYFEYIWKNSMPGKNLLQNCFGFHSEMQKVVDKADISELFLPRQIGCANLPRMSQ